MALTYAQLRQRYDARALELAPSTGMGQGGDSGGTLLTGSGYSNDFTLDDGTAATFDPSTGAFITARDLGDPNGVSRFQRTRYNADGTTTDLGIETLDRAANQRRNLLTMAALGGAVVSAGALLGPAAAGTPAAAGAAATAPAAASAGGAAGGGAASLLTPTNALIGASLINSVVQGRQQTAAIDNANATNERIAADNAAAAERTRLDAERARQAAIAAGGSAPGRSPEGTALARNRNRAGLSSTMLTGPGGVAPSTLALGRPTLLGALG